ncbi:MAG: carboxypeptidase M32 [Rickettsiaceae bacterium]
MSYQQLEKQLEIIVHLQNISNLAYWDASTCLPKGSAASRHKEIATFDAVIHEMSTCQEMGNLIDGALAEIDRLNEWQKANVQIVKKNYNSETCISAELQHEYSMVSNESEFAWREARARNDFKSLAPHLDSVFAVVRKIANLKSAKLGKSPIDVLIDAHDPDRTSAEVDDVFNTLKTELPKLISKIIEKQKTEKVLPISKVVDESTQKAIGLRVMEKMGFNMDCGRLDKSAHPFCRGSNDDVRLTTRYDENNFLTGLFGIIHETGHGLYQQNLPVKYRNQPVGGPKGMAFHESQSLVMEMQAGTSRQFIEFLARLLKDEFSFSGPEFSGENLYKIVTRVKPGLIRVDADEVTYPLHVILRFEIEREIIENNLKAKDLPALWNSKMQEYLGLLPETDSNGCMQDIHWPSGALGYFPSYTNGAIIASMLMKKAKAEYKSIDAELSVGNFASLNEYLNNNLRNYGSSKTSQALLNASTGHDTVQPNIFLNYLEEKYLN